MKGQGSGPGTAKTPFQYIPHALPPLFSARSPNAHRPDSPLQWGNLERGPYDIGVRVSNTCDYSLAYWPRRD